MEMKRVSVEIATMVLLGIALLLSAIAVGVAVGSLHQALKIQQNLQSANQLEFHSNQSINAKVISLLKPIEDKLSNITKFVPLLHSIQSSARVVVQVCSAGVKDGRVSDLAMTASSSWDDNHSPEQGRLDFAGNPVAHSWSSKYSRVGEWIQVKFTTPIKITGVVTQGRGDSNDQQWVTSFKISYSDSPTSFQTIQYSNGTGIIFPGNRDKNTYVMNRFPQPITAQYFRLDPQTWYNHISLRLDYLNC